MHNNYGNLGKSIPQVNNGNSEFKDILLSKMATIEG